MNFRRLPFIAVSSIGLLLLLGITTCAQSSDQNLPSAVLSNEISGTIAALDVGDPRVTRHFYAFTGTPGDLLITLDSKNLNGDIDVFTAVTLRPLMKTAMYANVQSAEVTKGIYLRAKQILILRVEARTPNDDPGTYRIHFGGSFEPFSGGIPVAENSPAANEAGSEGRNPNRLSSVGATIVQPAEAAPPEAKPSPEKSAEETAAEKAKAAKPTARPSSRRSTARNARGRGSRSAPSKPATAEKKTASESNAKTESEAAKKEPPKEGEDKTAPATEKPAEAKPVTANKAQENVAPQPGARLIIEEKDGTKIERPMSTVRRIVVEGGTIVIVLKTGRIERVAMSVVARMAIEPQ